MLGPLYQFLLHKGPLHQVPLYKRKDPLHRGRIHQFPLHKGRLHQFPLQKETWCMYSLFGLHACRCQLMIPIFMYCIGNSKYFAKYIVDCEWLYIFLIHDVGFEHKKFFF